MFIGKVVGTVWATRKHTSLVGKKLLLVQPVDGTSLEPYGEVTMAVDHSMDAGTGNVVLINDEGNSARQMLGDKLAPVRTVVCGVVDEVLKNKEYRRHH